ncbi:MAG: ABC transporter permease subunit [Terrimicrobiaceae bacterium]|nr:ABC transporter permease subunit [Terrimicrobiaceae bacterium]
MSEKRVRWRQIGQHKEIYLFVLPALVLVGLFQYYPAASGIFHSFFRWNGAEIAEFVGLENYIDLVANPAFWDSFKVAFILGVWNIVKMVPAVLVAVCIHRCRSPRMQFLYRTLFVVPMVIPGLVIALIWRSFFFESTQGYLNLFLNATHLMDVLQWMDATFGWGGIFVEGRPPAWLGDPRLILTACIVWGFPWVGSFAVLTHLAKLQSINKDLYEAGEIDGVNWFTKFTKIELPLILGSIYVLLVFVIIDTIKDAGMILALAGIEGGPGGKVTVPALFMLRKAFVEQSMGYACAVGIILTLVVMALQKLSAGFLNWGEIGHRHRAVLRGILLIAGAGLVAFAGMYLVGGLLIAASIPWNSVARRLPNRERVSSPLRRKLRTSVGESPWTIWKRRTGDRLLRVGKHATIWAVLAFAFLPLYLMLVVSLKDNTQFYAEPTLPTFPLHWNNWVDAWRMITPTLANSIFISTLATFFTLFAALSAAYFFARIRMPFSGLLWNAILVLMMMPTIANLIPLFRLLGDMNLLNTLSALIIVGAAAGQAFAIFVLRGFVADIPADLFEAAELDGAGHFKQMMLVVVPLSGPILGTVGVMTFLANWNDFVLPLIVMRDHIRLPVMVALLRLSGEYIKFWGPLMAGYALASIPIIFLFVSCMKLFVKGLTEGASKG